MTGRQDTVAAGAPGGAGGRTRPRVVESVKGTGIQVQDTRQGQLGLLLQSRFLGTDGGAGLGGGGDMAARSPTRSWTRAGDRMTLLG